MSPEHAVKVLGARRRLLEVHSANEPAAASALRADRCALGIVVSGDVLSRRTLEVLDVPLFNVHLSDPAFVRGMPPVFWEILGGHDSIRLTLHALTPQVDGGPIVAQREIPIVWQSTLAGTIAQTLGLCGREIALLLADGLPPILDGSAKPRPGTPGPLRTTPTIQQMWQAGRICRKRARESR